MDRLITQKELAECLRITPRQIRNLNADGVFQGCIQGRKYDLPKCIATYIDYKVASETGRTREVSKEKVSAEHEEVKKQISILKLRKLRRELHEASDVQAYLADMLIHFKTKLESVPGKLALSVAGEKDTNKIMDMLDRGIADALEELSEYDPDRIDGMSGRGLDDDEDEEEDEPEEQE